MIEGWESGAEAWRESLARAQRAARHRRRDQWLTNAVGYLLLAAGMAWICLRWLS